ncbi:MAG: Gfo/Idh/MocA family protein [bacterium]
MAARVAVIGANGYGVYHRRSLVPLLEAGAAQLVGLCDLAPILEDAEAPLPASVGLFTDYRELLAATRPDVAIVATPPHTHLEIATAAARAGADVLVEKPPLLSTAEHEALARVLAETGMVCQVGFQALGSAALAELVDAIRADRLGRVIGIGTYGAWQRPDSYYTRTAWAGRRELDGRPVLDGALANPFAHAVMQCLAVAEGSGPVALAGVELERYRARPIEVDDTGVMRVRLAGGMTIVVAVTLCGDEWVEPVLIVHAERGRAVLGYMPDTLQLPGDAVPREVSGRIGLLENLLEHRSQPGVDLLAPLERTAPFTALVDAIAADNGPAPIDRRHLSGYDARLDRVVTVPGVTEVVRDAAERLALPSELGIPWARSAGAASTS